jgi:hypothetical protein
MSPARERDRQELTIKLEGCTQADPLLQFESLPSGFSRPAGSREDADMITVSKFVEGLKLWADERGWKGLEMVYGLDGGYEAWFQAEIAGYLNKHVKDAAAREQGVYKHGDWRVDLLLNPKEPSGDQILVEIKTQTINQEAYIQFLNEVEKDKKKLDGDPPQDGRNNIYTGNTALILALTINETTAKMMLSWKPDDMNRIFGIILQNTPFTFFLAVSTTEGEWEVQK